MEVTQIPFTKHIGIEIKEECTFSYFPHIFLILLVLITITRKKYEKNYNLYDF